MSICCAHVKGLKKLKPFFRLALWYDFVPGWAQIMFRLISSIFLYFFVTRLVSECLISRHLRVRCDGLEDCLYRAKSHATWVLPSVTWWKSNGNGKLRWCATSFSEPVGNGFLLCYFLFSEMMSLNVVLTWKSYMSFKKPTRRLTLMSTFTWILDTFSLMAVCHKTIWRLLGMPLSSLKEARRPVTNRFHGIPCQTWPVSMVS